MTWILQISGKEFKTTTINTLKALNEKVEHI